MTAPVPGIEIENTRDYPVNADRLLYAARATLTQNNAVARGGLTIVLTDDDEVRALNREYRHVDSVTDVLTFPADPLPDTVAQELDEPPYLGDLVIAYPYTCAQAERLGHSPADSLSLLVVHGTLHLLGYDHDTPEHRTEMWAAQAKALRTLGISEGIVPGLEGASHGG